MWRSAEFLITFEHIYYNRNVWHCIQPLVNVQCTLLRVSDTPPIWHDCILPTGIPVLEGRRVAPKGCTKVPIIVKFGTDAVSNFTLIGSHLTISGTKTPKSQILLLRLAWHSCIFIGFYELYGLRKHFKYGAIRCVDGELTQRKGVISRKPQ